MKYVFTGRVHRYPVMWLAIGWRLFASSIFAQQPVGMDEAVAIALARHPAARNAVLSERKDALMQQQSVELPPAWIKYRQYGVGRDNDRFWSVTQDFGSIPEHFRRARYYRAVASANRAERTLMLDELVWQVKAAYLDVVYRRQRLQTMREHNHYLEALIDIAEIRLAADSIPELAVALAGTRYAAWQSRMHIAEEELKRAKIRLCELVYATDGDIDANQQELELYRIHSDKAADTRFDPVKHKALDNAQLQEAKSAAELEKSRLYPGIRAGYVYRYPEGENTGRWGWIAGVSVPLWRQPQRARIKQAEIDLQIKTSETEYRQFADRQHVETLKSLLDEYFVQISLCRENLLVEAGLVLEEVEREFAEGRIADHAEAIARVVGAVSATLNHLEYISLYNQTALELEYYTQ